MSVCYDLYMSQNRLVLVFIVLVAAMVAFGFHISAQRPPEAELIVPSTPLSPEVTLTTPVMLYAYDGRLDMDAAGNILCGKKGIVSVSRTIPKTDAPLRATLELLLADPLTEEERGRGLSSQFPLEGVSIQDVSVKGDTATITIDDPKYLFSGGACRVNVMAAQIAATAKQFQGIEQVRFEPEGLLEP